MRPELSIRENGAASAELLACPECDLLQRAVELPPRAAAVCRRCGAVLYRELPDWLDRTLAYTLAAAILFVVANAFPIVVMEMQGHRSIHDAHRRRAGPAPPGHDQRRRC